MKTKWGRDTEGEGVIAKWMVNMEEARVGWGGKLFQGSFASAQIHVLMQIHTQRNVHPCLLVYKHWFSIYSSPRNSDYVNVALPVVTPLSERWRSDEWCFPSRLSREPFASFATRVLAIICGIQSAHCFSWSHFSSSTFVPAQSNAAVYALMLHLFRLNSRALWAMFSQPKQWILQE